MNPLRLSLLPFIALLSAIFSHHSRADACPALCSQLDNQINYKAKTQTLISKNKDYLERLDKNDTSQRVKVNSNIFVATLHVETADNNIAALKKTFAEKGCSTCKPM